MGSHQVKAALQEDLQETQWGVLFFKEQTAFKGASINTCLLYTSDAADE